MFRDIAPKTDNAKDQQMVRMQEELNSMGQRNFNLTSTAALQAAQAAFTLPNGTLKVIQSMIEKNTSESCRGRPKRIGSAPKKFAGDDLKKYALWKRETRSYIGGQWAAFKHCVAVRLVLLSFLTGDASEVVHMFMPYNFTDDAQEESGKSAALEAMLLWLDGRFRDFIAQQRAREQIKDCRQKESDEFQMWYLQYNKLLHMAGYVHENYGTTSDFNHLYERLRPGLLKLESIREVLIDGKSGHKLMERAAHWDSQCPRSTSSTRKAEAKMSPTAKEFQEVQRQLTAAQEANKKEPERSKESGEARASRKRNFRRLDSGRAFKTLEERKEAAIKKPCTRGAECTYGEDGWFASH